MWSPCIHFGSDSEEEEEPVMKSKKSSKQKGTTSKAGPPKKDPVQFVSETGESPSSSGSTFLLFQSLYMNIFLSAALCSLLGLESVFLSARRLGRWQLPVLEESLQTERRCQNHKARSRKLSLGKQSSGDVSLLQSGQSRAEESSCAQDPEVGSPSSAQTNAHLRARLLWRGDGSPLRQEAGSQHQTKGGEFFSLRLPPLF